MRRTAIILAVLALTGCLRAEVSEGATAPVFTLQNANDSTFSMEHSRTQPLVLLFTTKDLGDNSLAWHDSIHAKTHACRIQSVLDLSDVSSWLRGLARVRIRAKGSKAIIDWDGEVSEEWRGEDRSQVVAFVVMPDGTVARRVTGEATPENVARVVEGVLEE